MTSHLLRIGVLAQTSVQQQGLVDVVEACELAVAKRLLVEQVPDEPAGTDDSVDAWVVNMDPETDETEPLDTWLDQWSIPVIFCEGTIPPPNAEDYSAWERRLTNKLRQLAGTINLAQSGDALAQRVWVLAASTGGPSAVQAFLQALPPDLDVGFVYVQHIDKGYNETLVQMMSRHTAFTAAVVEHGDLMQTNQVAIIPPDKITTLSTNGTFAVSDQPWQTRYSPSVDALVADVAHSYGERSGVIVFSGMGNDGAASARLMRKQGGQVWAQSPEDCTSSAMPEAVIATGNVVFKGSPETLAQAFVKNLQTTNWPQQPQMGLV